MKARAQVQVSREGRIIHQESVYGHPDMVVFCEAADLCAFFEEDGPCTSVITVHSDGIVNAWVRYFSEAHGFHVAKSLGMQA